MSRFQNNTNNSNYPFHNVQNAQPSIDFRNKNNVMVNNLNDNLLKESITEYRLNVDSFDRDIKMYPDPFNFSISFAPVVAGSKVRKEKELNKDPISLYSKNTNYIIDESTLLINTNQSSILKDFQNIKFIRIDSLIMPRFNKFIINTVWNWTILERYKIDTDEEKSLFNDRYVQLHVRELDDNNNYATNTITDKSFVIVPDKKWGNHYYKGSPYYAIKMYHDSTLGNLSRLTFDLYDSYGEQIKINKQEIQYELNQLNKIVLIQQSSVILDSILSKYNIPATLDDYPSLISDIFNCITLLNSNSKLFTDALDTVISGLSNSDSKIIKEFINSMNYMYYLQTVFTEMIKLIVLINKKITTTPLILIDNIGFSISLLSGDNIDTVLSSFVDDNSYSFINAVYNSTNYSIDEFINEFIWNNTDYQNSNFYNNIQTFYTAYSTSISNIPALFNIFKALKTELINMPLNKNIQFHVMFVLGIWENELSTKISY